MTVIQHPFRLLAALLLFLSIGMFAHGQGSGHQDGRELVQALPAHDGADRDGERPKLVDLRDKLPAVGEQSMNDCVAWAYGYAARSYLEAVDQDWSPDHPGRIFSPTFIYKQVVQIKDGKDMGSNPLMAIELLQNQGAATLLKEPYKQRDFQSPVNAAAITEAKEFRIAGYEILENGEAVRDALAAGHIVCIGIRNNPVFDTGRYDIYTAQMHEQGVQRRRDDQRHGYHAMVIAGYDDHREAFLFMNSWSQRWGQGGYVWVSYDAADSFNLADKESEHLVDYAIVMFDRREPVARIGGQYKAITPEDVSVATRFRRRGLGRDGRPSYDLTIDLVGPSEIQESIKRVTWDYHANGKRTFETARPRAIVSTSDRKQTIKAQITLDDGTKLERSADILLPEAESHEVNLQRIVALSHVERLGNAENNDKRHAWRQTFSPQMSLTDWAALDRIEWRLDPREAVNDQYLRTNLAPIGKGGEALVYQHREPTQPGTNQPSLAYPSGVGFAPITGEAHFIFKDGSTVEVTLPADPLPPPSDNEVQLSIQLRPFGSHDDEDWWFYELKGTFPERWAPLVTAGSFRTFGQIGADQDGPGQLTTGLEPLGHYLTGYARKSFTAGYQVKLRNGPKRGPFDAPLRRTTADKLLQGELGEARHIFLPHYDEGIGTHLAKVDEKAREWRYREEYLGLGSDGRPRWRIEPFHVEFKAGNTWDGEFDYEQWRFDREDAKVIELRNDDPRALSRWVIELPFDEEQPTATMTVPMTLYGRESADGIAHETTLTIKPRTPATTGLSLRAVTQTPQPLLLLPDTPTDAFLQVDLVGGLDAFAQVRRVDYLIHGPGGWVAALPAHVKDLKRAKEELRRAVLPTTMATGRRADHSGRVRAVLRRTDGSVQALETRPIGVVPWAETPAVHLTAISRYWGTENGRPTWQADLTIDGRVEAHAQIDSVTFTAEAEDGSRLPVKINPEDPTKASLLTSKPARAHATITFKDGRDPAKRTATVLTLRDTILPDGEFRLARQHLHTNIDYSLMIGLEDLPEINQYEGIYLRAPLRDLQAVQSVRYTVFSYDLKEIYEVDSAGMTKPIEVSEDGPGMASGDFKPAPHVKGVFMKPLKVWEDVDLKYHAEVSLKDGKTVKLTPSNHQEDHQRAEVTTSQAVPMDASGRSATLLMQPLKYSSQSVSDVAEYSFADHPSVISYVAPHSAAFLEYAEPRSITAKQTLMFIDGEAETKRRRLRKQAEIEVAKPRPDEIRIDPLDGQRWVITPDFNGEAFEGVERVVFDVTYSDGSKATFEPLGWLGFAHERFAITVDREPKHVTANVITVDGERRVLGTN